MENLKESRIQEARLFFSCVLCFGCLCEVSDSLRKDVLCHVLWELPALWKPIRSVKINRKLLCSGGLLFHNWTIFLSAWPLRSRKVLRLAEGNVLFPLGVKTWSLVWGIQIWDFSSTHSRTLCMWDKPDLKHSTKLTSSVSKKNIIEGLPLLTVVNPSLLPWFLK